MTEVPTIDSKANKATPITQSNSPLLNHLYFFWQIMEQMYICEMISSLKPFSLHSLSLEEYFLTDEFLAIEPKYNRESVIRPRLSYSSGLSLARNTEIKQNNPATIEAPDTESNARYRIDQRPLLWLMKAIVPTMKFT